MRYPGFCLCTDSMQKKVQSNNSQKFAFQLHPLKILHQVFSYFRHCLTYKR